MRNAKIAVALCVALSCFGTVPRCASQVPVPIEVPPIPPIPIVPTFDPMPTFNPMPTFQPVPTLDHLPTVEGLPQPVSVPSVPTSTRTERKDDEPEFPVESRTQVADFVDVRGDGAGIQEFRELLSETAMPQDYLLWSFVQDTATTDEVRARIPSRNMVNLDPNDPESWGRPLAGRSILFVLGHVEDGSLVKRDAAGAIVATLSIAALERGLKRCCNNMPVFVFGCNSAAVTESRTGVDQELNTVDAVRRIAGSLNLCRNYLCFFSTFARDDGDYLRIVIDRSVLGTSLTGEARVYRRVQGAAEESAHWIDVGGLRFANLVPGPPPPPPLPEAPGVVVPPDQDRSYLFIYLLLAALIAICLVIYSRRKSGAIGVR